jgi:hypothetical protein
VQEKFPPWPRDPSPLLKKKNRRSVLILVCSQTNLESQLHSREFFLSSSLSRALSYAKTVGINRYRGPSPSSISTSVSGTIVVFREPRPEKQKPRRNQLGPSSSAGLLETFLRNGGARFSGSECKRSRSELEEGGLKRRSMMMMVVVMRMMMVVGEKKGR